MAQVSFDVTNDERDLLIKIAERAEREIFKPNGIDQDQLATMMDLSATIAQGCPLDLQRLLDADAFNFAHDVCGIRRHINRKTGKLENCFLPRFYRQSAKRKAYQAYGTAGKVTRPTAREAAQAYFAEYPQSRKCDVIEGETDGEFFTVRYGRKSAGEWPESFKNVTRKTTDTLPA